MPESVVIIIGRGTSLDLAQDALGEGGMRVWVIPTAQEAARTLPSHVRPRIGAVMISLLEDHDAGLDLVSQLRATRRFAGVPITVWAMADMPALVARAYEFGASSALLLTGGDEDAALLTRAIHYWKAINEPSRLAAPATSGSEL